MSQDPLDIELFLVEGKTLEDFEEKRKELLYEYKVLKVEFSAFLKGAMGADEVRSRIVKNFFELLEKLLFKGKVNVSDITMLKEKY